jgi:NAD(P)-dependent dehydrogenase (short-subunit alcohol dehydrogenase family)
MELAGRVAVVTGGAGGIGAALCRALLAEGMKVVVADHRADAVAEAEASLQASGDVLGVVADVTSIESMEALADATWTRYGGCHLLCNNAGVGAPAALVWETTPNDWRWVHGVNVMGVVNGILAFVPRMIASGEPGHVINTSSGDGGIEPIPTASVYATSKAAVSSLTECLAQQLVSEGTALRASIFYPSGGLLRTGMWESERNRPPELAREKPRPTESMTIERLEAMAEEKGFPLSWQDLDELAQIVVAGLKDDDEFVHMIDRDSMGPTLHRRADELAAGRLPTHEKGPLG